MPEFKSNKLIEKTVAIALLLIVLFASPLLDWWSQSALPWFTPYLLWLLIILVTAFARYSDHNNDV